MNRCTCLSVFNILKGIGMSIANQIPVNGNSKVSQAVAFWSDIQIKRVEKVLGLHNPNK